jgi:acetolactate synthase-1/3 small subunit
MSDKTKRVVSVLVENESSALSRVSGLFAGRGYNIETLTVAPVPDTHRSRITIVTNGSQRVLEQITKQLVQHRLLPRIHKPFKKQFKWILMRIGSRD